ncbi:hypothetical protein X777_13840 [Ooceraea biroi]|uniref:Uncharacterized protein n=1 Tax=Ooceraea biroi TaxID=2015173 RepID=A0A026VXX4_OOCBI|nr:hypothetical protein X777_13840 [Ooceraea biroi]
METGSLGVRGRCSTQSLWWDLRNNGGSVATPDVSEGRPSVANASSRTPAVVVGLSRSPEETVGSRQRPPPSPKEVFASTAKQIRRLEHRNTLRRCRG